MGGKNRVDWSGLDYRQVMDSCEHANEPLDTTKCTEFHD